MKRTCPACSKYDNKPVFINRFEVPLNHTFYKSYNVVECACGMIYADDIPSQEEFSAYYRALAKKSSRFEENGYKEPEWYVNIHKSTAEWLDQHVGLAGKTILDSGCFSGDLMKQMNGYGGRCFGYDPSVTGIIISKSLNLNVSQAE